MFWKFIIDVESFFKTAFDVGVGWIIQIKDKAVHSNPQTQRVSLWRAEREGCSLHGLGLRETL